MARKGERRDRIVNGKPLFSNQIICSATRRGARGRRERGRERGGGEEGLRVKRRRRKMAEEGPDSRCAYDQPFVTLLPNGPRALILYSSDRNRFGEVLPHGSSAKGWLLIKYTVQEYCFPGS